MSLQETPIRAGRRASKFSPANIERIKDFVAQGVNREKIAEHLGVTVGSLQVTCSRLGISLRKPNGCSYSRMSRPVPLGSSADGKHIGMASATPPKFETVLHYRGATQTAILPLTSSDYRTAGRGGRVAAKFKYVAPDNRGCGRSNQAEYD